MTNPSPGPRRLYTPRTSRRYSPRLDPDTVGQFTESIARFFGTGRYLLLQTIVVLVWIALNLVSAELRWDPYPFILLNLAFSTQAAYAAPLILLAQNRQENRDRVALDEDRRRATQTKADTEYLARELAALRLAIGEIATRDYLRGELDQVYDLIDQVAAGTLDAGTARSHINEMTMRQNNWTLGTYCESYCRVVTVHHTIEDQSMFPYLRRRDPRLAPVIDRLQAEHRVIHDVLDGVDRALVAFVAAGGGAAALAGLRDAADLLSDTLRSHLAYEERELVEPIARLGFA